MFKKIFTLILIGTIVISITGCTGQSDFFKKNKDEKKYIFDKNVTMPMTYVRTLNPAASKDRDTYFISKLVYEGLFSLDENMTPTLSLAKAYTYNGDNSVTIDLVDTTWHDGEKFTASDVAFSIKAHKRKGEESQYYSLVEGIEWSEVISSSSIKIYFSSKKHMNLAMLSFPIIPEHTFNNIEDATKEEKNFKPIGTGQYKVKTYSSDRELILVPNEAYDKEVASNTINFSILPAKAEMETLLESSAISLLPMISADRQTKFNSEKIKIANYASNEVEFIGFNFNRKPFDKKNIRKAIACSVNRDRIIEECYFNSGIKNNSIYFPNYLDVKEEKNQAYEYSLNTAEEYLEKAGFKDENGVGYLQNEEGEVLTVNILVNSDIEERVLYSEILKSSLEEISVGVTVTSLETASYEDALRAGNFDIFIGGYKFDEQVDLRPLLSQGDENYTGYSNEKLDDLLDDLQSGKTVEELKSTYSQIRKTIDGELPYFCVLFKTYGIAKATSLEGEVSPIFNNIYNNVDQLQTKREDTEK